MNGGPLPGSRPGDRRIINRDESADRPEAVESASPRAQVRPMVATPARSTAVGSEKNKRRFPAPSKQQLVIIGAVIVVLLGAAMWLGSRGAGTAIDSSKYQAVFLAGGQHYFGKLKAIDNEFFELTGVYYLYKQDDAAGQDMTDEQESSNLQLLKLVDDVHEPEDRMIISKSQVLFYENLRADGRVSQLIDQQRR